MPGSCCMMKCVVSLCITEGQVPPSATEKGGEKQVNDKDKFDTFTERARKVLSLAQEEAQRFQHNYIGTEHLLLGLVREGEGVAAKVLSNLGVELNKVRSAVEFIIGRGDRIVLGEIGLTPRAKKVIELAVDEAQRMNHYYIGTEHLLLALMREGEGIAAGVLESLGVNLGKVRTQTIQVLSQPGIHQKMEVPPQLQEALKVLDAILHEKEAALQKQEYELAAELRNREVNLRDHIARLESDWYREHDNKESEQESGEEDTVSTQQSIQDDDYKVQELSQDDRDRVTERASKVLSLAQEEAQR